MEYYDPCTGVREEDPLRVPTNARARLRAARRKEGEQKYYDTYASRVAGSLIPPQTQGKHIVTSFGNLGELAGDRSSAPNQYQMRQPGRSGIRISGSGDCPSLPISPDVLRTIETTTLNGHKVNHCGQVMDAHWPAVDRIIHGDFYHVKGKAIGETLSSKLKDSQWNENSNIKEGKRMRFRNYEMDPVASNRPFTSEHPPQRVYNTCSPEPAGKAQKPDHRDHFVGSGMAHVDDWSTSADVPKTTVDDYLGGNVDDRELDAVMGVRPSPVDHDHFGHRNVGTGIRIQQGSHDSLEDAGVCAELALLKMLKGVEHGSAHRKQHIVHSIPVTLKSFPLALMKGSPNLFAHPAALSNSTDQQPASIHAVLPSLVTPSLIINGHASLLTYVPVAHTVIVDRRSALRKLAMDCSRRNVATVKEGSNKITDSQEIAKGGCVEESMEKRNVHTPLYYGEDGHDPKPSLWSEGVPPQPISGGDVDAVAKIVKELAAVESSEDAYYSACKKWQLETTQLVEGYSTGNLIPPPPPPTPPKPRFMWVQLSTSAQEFDSTATSNEAAHITAVERLNARVLEVVEAAPQHTMVVVVTANCKEGNGNKFSKAHGAMFAFSRAPKTEADISGASDTSCQSYLKGINSSSSAGCQHA